MVIHRSSGRYHFRALVKIGVRLGGMIAPIDGLAWG
jgi:hypothetical protein